MMAFCLQLHCLTRVQFLAPPMSLFFDAVLLWMCWQLTSPCSYELFYSRLCLHQKSSERPTVHQQANYYVLRTFHCVENVWFLTKFKKAEIAGIISCKDTDISWQCVHCWKYRNTAMTPLTLFVASCVCFYSSCAGGSRVVHMCSEDEPRLSHRPIWEGRIVRSGSLSPPSCRAFCLIVFYWFCFLPQTLHSLSKPDADLHVSTYSVVSSIFVKQISFTLIHNYKSGLTCFVWRLFMTKWGLILLKWTGLVAFWPSLWW